MKTKKLSSSHRESKRKLVKFHCHPNSKAVGCVSGIFHFFAGRHSSSCKRLPSASRRKDESRLISPPKSLPSTESAKKTASPPNEVAGVSVDTKKNASHISMTVAQTATAFLRNLHLRRHELSCKVLHSALRSSSPDATESPQRPTTLVERLMGLDDEYFPASSPETTAGKERKLLGAVRSCEERLKSLKQIIAAVRAAEGGRKIKKAVEAVEWIKVDNVASSDRTVRREGEGEGEGEGSEEDGDSSIDHTVKSMDGGGNPEQPSPVSVLLDASIISPTKFPSKRSEHEIENEAQITRTQPSEVGVISSAGKCNIKEPCNYVGPAAARRRSLTEGCGRHQRRQLWRYKTRSGAMVETVCEVVERCSWEERKEAGKVAMALERGIFGDLVDELGRDLALHCNIVVPIRGTCRKRLHF